MTIGDIGMIVSNYENYDCFWDTQYEGGCDDLEEIIRHALELFNTHPAPYRIVIADNQGHIVFSKTKFHEEDN